MRTKLTIAMISAGLRPATAYATRSIEAAYAPRIERLPVPQPSPRNTKTSLNMEQQREVWQAAQDKRASRQARNLASAGIPQGDLL